MCFGLNSQSVRHTMETDNHLVPEIGNACGKGSTDHVSVLTQMAEYDFNAPINVTMIFEDSDDEIDNAFENVQERETIQANNNDKDTFDKECALESSNVNKHKYKPYCSNKNHKIHKNKSNFEENFIGKIVNNKKYIEKIRENIGHVDAQQNINKSVTTLHSECVVVNGIREDTEHNESTTQTFVEDLLDKLSENLLMIMKSFYYYYNLKHKRFPQADVDCLKLEKTFRFIKSHFFEISYTTIETIILPLEQNATLINQFLDNTMMIAKLKFSTWNVQKHHVQALFNEIIRWAKKKQAHLKTIKQNSNENFSLRQHLIKPPQPYPRLQSALNSKNVSASSSNSQDEMWCIFRSGAPGSQISINVNPDTLLGCTKQFTNTNERTENQNTFASIGKFPSRPPPPYENSNKYYHQPPLCINQNYVHPSQNRYIIGQQQQNRQNIGYPCQGYQTQVPYVNMNRMPPCINVNHEMNESGVEQQISPRPVITNVTSLHPEAYKNVRCCMCAKIFEQRHYIHSNSPARPTYCSNLCQELDIQVRSSLCRSNT